MRLASILLTFAFGTASTAQTVTATIPPLAGIIGDLTRGVTAADSLLPAQADPHHFTVAPSQIRTINSATRIFAVGQDMEPWLERFEPHLAEGVVLKLGEIEPVHPFLLDARQIGTEAENEHEDEHEDEHNDEHDDEGHEDEHAHGVIDPHMWLSPEVLAVWAEEITTGLSADMPEHGERLSVNLEAFKGDLAQISTDLAAVSASFAEQEIKVVVTHDAFQYLEVHLGLVHAGMLSDIQDNAVGARSLSAISQLDGNICLIIDPNERLPEGILPDAARATIDPLGAEFIGNDRFTLSFFGAITQALSSCL